MRPQRLTEYFFWRTPRRAEQPREHALTTSWDWWLVPVLMVEDFLHQYAGSLPCTFIGGMPLRAGNVSPGT